MVSSVCGSLLAALGLAHWPRSMAGCRRRAKQPALAALMRLFGAGEVAIDTAERWKSDVFFGRQISE